MGVSWLIKLIACISGLLQIAHVIGKGRKFFRNKSSNSMQFCDFQSVTKTGSKESPYTDTSSESITVSKHIFSYVTKIVIEDRCIAKIMQPCAVNLWSCRLWNNCFEECKSTANRSKLDSPRLTESGCPEVKRVMPEPLYILLLKIKDGRRSLINSLAN